ncbi:hypothetical protein NM688_g7468 [Phlebia brevispora]|uniref:Uncharacterized protein n=1 Tax=Phlebia brevispora TaxID=194682 RepID=A0ACC1S4S4_9APHY|nr:hypothetical protein NM688_g7468 [Phlebia brevispora]
MHNAWPVNFNMSLSSFEPSVKSVRALIDLALASPLPTPPRILFVSSVGTLRHIDPTKPCKEGLIDATVSVGTGYSESKWVSEQILNRASKQTPLRTVAVRVGQLTGSSISGAWKPAEWVPALVRSSAYLKCLPVTNKQISWVSVDGAARALTEMRDSDIPNLHLGHPRPVPWSSVMDAAAKTLNIPIVPYEQWFSLLKASGEGLSADSEVEMMRQNPALKILDFFGNGLPSKDGTVPLESLGLPALDMTEALKVAPSLAPESLPLLSGGDANKWISYWKKVGFLP